MTRVKICGLRTVTHAMVAAETGAHFLGVVFAPSKRQVTVEQAQEIVTKVRQKYKSRAPFFVGVFVNETPARVKEIADTVDLDIIQLSGDERVADYTGLGYPIIKSIRGESGETSGGAVPYMLLQGNWPRGYAGDGGYLPLIDGTPPGSYGGTGVLADWTYARQLALKGPIMLAGGLSPENVADAIRAVHPWAVDVSSGVETGGVKDSVRIFSFIQEVQNADIG